ncbi:Flp pilus assembly protein CpaB [bacterium]|nr:MAG: Flp pilus assembly protein CpaB [bacterium]
MRSNRKIIFGLLLIVGAFGFYKVFRMLSPGESPRVATGNTATNGDPNVQPVSLKNTSGRVAEARVDIPANTIVTPDMLRMVSYEGPTIQGFITDIESQGAGYITRVDIPAKAKIRPEYDFVGHVSETGIAGLLRTGTRAMVIPMANKPTLHDLVRIGNYVDILGAFDGQESRTVIQNVRVLGVDVSANDYPNVNVAMRGAFKADPKGSAPNPATGPTPTPTPGPANAARPEPALTLEVTPRQAAALQLAMASNATLDYLVRPALPGNRSSEVAPLPGDANSPTGEGTLQTVSVTKRQIAPYAESRKAVGGGGTVRNASTGGSSSNTTRIREPLGGFSPPPDFPSSNPNPGLSPVTPVIPVQSPEIKPSAPVPTPTQVYNIPIYGDGRVVRTETVPLPSASR